MAYDGVRGSFRPKASYALGEIKSGILTEAM